MPENFQVLTLCLGNCAALLRKPLASSLKLWILAEANVQEEIEIRVAVIQTYVPENHKSLKARREGHGIDGGK
jgi:hypothetical protein